MKNFLFTSILFFLFIFSFSLSNDETKKEKLNMKKAYIEHTLPSEGETKYNMPFSILFEKKDGKYFAKEKVRLILSNNFFKMTMKKNNNIPSQNVKVNGRNFDEIAKGSFSITKEKDLFLMVEEPSEN